jgi:Spy/CpxP family protein refolding chaperone
MKRLSILCLAAALLVAVAPLLRAEGPEGLMGPGMHGMQDMAHFEEFLAKALDLTADQKAAAQKIHADLAAKAQPLMEQHRQQMEEVHALLDGPSPDATEIGQKMIAAHATGKQLEALHEDAMTQFSALLNADQKAKLEQLHAMHREHGEHGPFGGPGF